MFLETCKKEPDNMVLYNTIFINNSITVCKKIAKHIADRKLDSWTQIKTKIHSMFRTKQNTHIKESFTGAIDWYALTFNSETVMNLMELIC